MDSVRNEYALPIRGGTEPHRLEVKLSSPRWLPIGAMTVTFTENRSNHPATYQIQRGQTLTIPLDLSQEAGFIELLADRLFQPKALGIGADTRFLGPMCQACRIMSPDGMIALFEVRAGAV